MKLIAENMIEFAQIKHWISKMPLKRLSLEMNVFVDLLDKSLELLEPPKPITNKNIEELIRMFLSEVDRVTDLDQAADNVFYKYAPKPHNEMDRFGFEVYVAGYEAGRREGK